MAVIVMTALWLVQGWLLSSLVSMVRESLLDFHDCDTIADENAISL